MPIKDETERKAYMKDYHAEWYPKNREKRLKQVSDRRKRIRKQLKEYKVTLKCEICEENHPACLDFHHNGEKDLDVSSMVSQGYSFKRIKEEIEKCNVWCSNCHRKYHFSEKFEGL